MAQTVGRNIAAPLLFLNFIMYLIVVWFASWSVNKYINGQTNHPSLGGNGATMFFLTFALLAGVIGIASKVAGGSHLRAWRNDSLAAAGSSSLVAWAVTALAFGFGIKEIDIGGNRGWRLKMVELFIGILFFTQLLYVVSVHAGLFSGKYGPGYRDADSDLSGAAAAGDPMSKGGAGVAGTRV